MKKDAQEKKNIFNINEEPILTCGWTDEDGSDHLQVIEGDIRNLMYQFAKEKFDHEETRKKAKKRVEKLLEEILEVVDAFENVFSNIEKKQDQVTKQMKKWLKNFGTIHKLLRNILSRQGVVRIDSLDQEFDPYRHRASETVTNPERLDGTIVEEVSVGYMWHDQVLRKSEVVVVRNSDSENEEKSRSDED